MKKGKNSKIAIAIMLLVAVSSINGFALSKGSKVGSLKIKNANDKHAWIPYIGKYVVTIFYNDPDAADVSDPAADHLKAADLPKTKYKGIGIANCKDTWKPDAAIRYVVRGKIAKYKSTILLDTDHTVKKRWGLGNCNNASVCIIIDKNKKVLYVGKFKSAGAARAAKVKILKIVKKAIGE